MNPKPKVVIMYLLWSQEPQKYLLDAILGVKNQTYPKESIEFLIVYNSHKHDEASSAQYIREHIAQHASELPHTTILEQVENLGFSGGNNVGMNWAIDHGFAYVFLHNGDGSLGANCILELVKRMNEEPNIGAAQALMLLDPEKHLINSSGNDMHYLGFGYCHDYRVKKDVIQLPDVKDIGYASGAAIMMRVDLLKKYGLWDKDYFMYHEDTDYSLRLRYHGYRIVLVSRAEFFHKYMFSKSIKKYYWMERNRYALLLLYFRIPTLLLLLPIGILFECGSFVFALLRGWWKEKVYAYGYWLSITHWRLWLSKRKNIQKNRTVRDRDILVSCVSGIYFQDESVENPVLRYFGNPVMKGYYWLVMRTLVWW